MPPPVRELDGTWVSFPRQGIAARDHPGAVPGPLEPGGQKPGGTLGFPGAERFARNADAQLRSATVTL